MAETGLAHPETIDDGYADPADPGRFILVVQVDQAWDGSNRQLGQLAEKLAHYQAAVADGILARFRPEAAGCQVAVQIHCQDLPSPAVRKKILNCCNVCHLLPVTFCRLSDSNPNGDQV